MRKRSDMRKRSIGDAVAPPPGSWKNLKVYPSGIDKKKITRTMMKRMIVIIVLIFAMMIIIPLLMFWPDISGIFKSEPVEMDTLLMISFPMGLMILIMIPATFLGLYLGMKKLYDAIPHNRVEVTDEKMSVKIKVSNQVAPRYIEIPLSNIKDVIIPDRSYFEIRRNETRFYHRYGGHKFKPRIGDYYNSFSDIENLLIIKLRKAVFVPYYDYVWTGGEVMKKGKKVDELVIGMDRRKHDLFRRDVIERSMIPEEGERYW
ncbi:MAG: hypothetical protein ACMUIG_08655 [Thermoplasmatota archaeon]